MCAEGSVKVNIQVQKDLNDQNLERWSLEQRRNTTSRERPRKTLLEPSPQRTNSCQVILLAWMPGCFGYNLLGWPRMLDYFFCLGWIPAFPWVTTQAVVHWPNWLQPSFLPVCLKHVTGIPMSSFTANSCRKKEVRFRALLQGGQRFSSKAVVCLKHGSQDRV